MRSKSLIGFIFLLASPICLACDNATESYFAWANLKVFPEKVSAPLSKAEAERREKAGEAYYIQLVCDSGDVLMLTKRHQQQIFFQIDYLSDADGIYGKLTTNSNGKVTEYVHRKKP